MNSRASHARVGLLVAVPISVDGRVHYDGPSLQFFEKTVFRKPPNQNGLCLFFFLHFFFNTLLGFLSLALLLLLFRLRRVFFGDSFSFLHCDDLFTGMFMLLFLWFP